MPAGTIGRLPGVAHRYVGVGLWRKAVIPVAISCAVSTTSAVALLERMQIRTTS